MQTLEDILDDMKHVRKSGLSNEFYALGMDAGFTIVQELIKTRNAVGELTAQMDKLEDYKDAE